MACTWAVAGAREDVVEALRVGHLDQASKLLAAERQRQPKDVDLWFLQGVVQAQSGQTDQALATFKNITLAHPAHAEAFNNLGVLAASKGQLDEARGYFEKALKTNPSYAVVHKNLGDINGQLAKSAYSKALMADPKIKPAPVQLSMLASTSNSPSPSTVRVPTPAPAPAPAPAASAPTPASIPPPAPVVAQTAVQAPQATTTPVKVTPPPAPAPKAAEDNAQSEDLAERKKVEDALRAWAKAWSKKDMDQYLATYAASFDPPGKMSRKAWEDERRVRIVGKRSIHVELSQFRIRIKGPQAQAQFVQQYDSDSFKGRSTKTLSLLKEKGRWQISSESAKPL